MKVSKKKTARYKAGQVTIFCRMQLTHEKNALWTYITISANNRSENSGLCLPRRWILFGISCPDTKRGHRKQWSIITSGWLLVILSWYHSWVSVIAIKDLCDFSLTCNSVLCVKHSISYRTDCLSSIVNWMSITFFAATDFSGPATK